MNGYYISISLSTFDGKNNGLTKSYICHTDSEFEPVLLTPSLLGEE